MMRRWRMMMPPLSFFSLGLFALMTHSSFAPSCKGPDWVLSVGWWSSSTLPLDDDDDQELRSSAFLIRHPSRAPPFRLMSTNLQIVKLFYFTIQLQHTNLSIFFSPFSCNTNIPQPFLSSVQTQPTSLSMSFHLFLAVIHKSPNLFPLYSIYSAAQLRYLSQSFSLRSFVQL